MKTTLLTRLASFVLVGGLSVLSAAAMPDDPTPAGYWNIETNRTTADYTVVRFYNAQHQLVYEERLPGLCLDLSQGTGLCRRTARKLNVALRQVLQHPETATRTTTMLATQLGSDRRVQRIYAVR